MQRHFDSENKIMFIVLFLSLGIWPSLSFAGASNDPSSPTSEISSQAWALLIAVDRYPDQQLRQRSDAVAQSKQIAALLKQNYGYAEDHVIELYNETATTASINQTFALLASRVKSQDLVFFYAALDVFEGAKGDLFLAPYDGYADQPWTLATAAFIQKLLSSVRARSKLVVGDECLRLASEFQKSGYPYRGSDTEEVTQLLSYCPPVEAGVAAASPFGLAMISALKGEAADAQGIITIKSLSDYLYRRTSAGLHAESLPARANSKFSFTPKRAAASPDLLNKLSKDNPPEARLAAIGELVSLVRAQTTSEQQALGEALSSQLRAITQDPSESPQVKTRAILALGQLQDQRGKETLVALLTTAPEKTVRQTALEALSQVDDATATAGIRQALQDPDAEIRAAAIRALANRHDEKAQDEIIRLALKDPDIIVRLSALGYLSILPSPAPHVSEQLTSLLKEPNADLRRETVVTLGAMAEIRAVPELLPLLKNDPEPSVRESAAFALGKLSHNDNRSEIEKALSESLKKDKEGSVRAAAAYALGQVGGATAEKRLVEALGSDDAKVRRTAAAALGELKSTRAVKDLIRALSDRDPEVRRAAAIALGKIGDPRAGDPLLMAVKDEVSYVSAAANQALAQIKASPREDDIAKRLSDPSPSVRTEALGLLAATKRPELAPQLLPLLADNDYGVRQAAIEALASFSDAETYASVKSALTSQNFLIRQGAITVLGRTGQQQAVAPLIQRLQDPNSAVRAEALRALGRLGNAQALEPVIAAAKSDYDANVRLAGVEALGKFLRHTTATAALEYFAQEDQDASVRRAATDLLKNAGYRK